MDWVPLSVALLALVAAGLAYREASRSSSRKLARTVYESLEELERQSSKLSRTNAEELERLQKQARRTGATLKRLDDILEGGDDDDGEGGEGEDVPGNDARASESRRVPAVRSNVVSIPWRGGRTG